MLTPSLDPVSKSPFVNMPTRSGASYSRHFQPSISSFQDLEAKANTKTQRMSSTKRKRTAASDNEAPVAPAESPRKRANNTQRAPVEVIDLTGDAPEPEPEPKPKKQKQAPKARKAEKSQEERRLKMFRKHAPQTYLEKLARATSQRYGCFI